MIAAGLASRPSNTPECLRQLCGRLPPGMLRISAATSNRAAAAAAAARYDTLCRDDERCLSPPPIPHQLRNAEQFTTTIYRSDFLVHVVTPHATPIALTTSTNRSDGGRKNENHKIIFTSQCCSFRAIDPRPSQKHRRTRCSHASTNLPEGTAGLQPDVHM